MNTYNSRDVVSEIVSRLSDRATARPFPHLRVIGPTPYGNSARRSSIFTNFTQNPPHVVGHKVGISPDQQGGTWSISEFSFTIPRTVDPQREDSFEDFKAVMSVELRSGNCELSVYSSLRGQLFAHNILADAEVSSDTFKVFRHDFNDSINIKYFKTVEEEVEEPFSLSIHFEKKIEYDVEGWTVEFKARNESQMVKFEDAKLAQGNISSHLTVEADDDGTYFKDAPEKDCTYLLTGYLLEFELAEKVKGGQLRFANELDGPVLRTFNAVPTQWTSTQVTFSDHYVGEERIPKMRMSPKSIEEFAGQLASDHGLGLDPVIWEPSGKFLKPTQLATPSFVYFRKRQLQNYWPS